MRLHLKYFGAIADVVQKKEEQFDFENNSLQALQLELETQYPEIKTIAYQFAVNRSIATDGITLGPDDEIALLPPFAGG